jgi:hypothetical protein
VTKALERLVLAEKQVTDPPNNNKDYTWQLQMERGYKGKMRKPGQVLPEGTFTKSPSEIANLLKQHSTDYGQASKKLNSYINRKGRDLQGEEKNRLYDAKETLKNAYGEQSKPQTETTSGADYPLYCTPDGHSGDNPTLFTGFDESILDEDMRGGHPTSERHFSDTELANVKTNVIARLKVTASKKMASILNSVQDPSTRISSVETDAVLGPSTNDSSDDAFQESKTPSSSDVLCRLRS